MQISCETLLCVIIHAFLCVLSVTKKATTNSNNTDTLLHLLIFCDSLKRNLNSSRIENQKSLLINLYYVDCKKNTIRNHIVKEFSYLTMQLCCSTAKNLIHLIKFLLIKFLYNNV